MIEQRDIGREWDVDYRQVANYLEANQLLVDCLQLAVVSDRAGIEAGLLLPPGEGKRVSTNRKRINE